jgi:hypothetical protein
VDMPPRPLGKPVADELGFVAGRVVHDHMGVEAIGHVLLNLIQKPAELSGCETSLA